MSLGFPIPARKRRYQLGLILATLPLLFVFQNCGKFEVKEDGALTLGSNTDVPINAPILEAQGKLLYANNCASCHGSVDTSTKRTRSASLISLAITSIPQMNGLRNLSSAEVEAISVALAAPASGPGVPGQPVNSLFACTPGQQSKTPMLKMTNREFRAALNGLLDGFSSSLKNDSQLIAAIDGIPSDITMMDRNTRKEQPLFINQASALGYFEAAYRAGALISTATNGLRDFPNTGQCLAATNLTQACHQSFVRELSSRAFRRPVNAMEGNALAATLWDGSLSKSELLQSTFASVVSMPDFMYKVYDTGNVSNLGPTVLNLTAHELASKVAFFLTGAPPDITLRALADSGQIRDAAVLSQQIDRLVGTAGAEETIRRLFRESYGYDVYDSFQYPSAFLNGQNLTGVQAAMTQELNDFFTMVVLQQRGSFSQIMTSTSTRMPNANLASIYGVGVNATNLPPERAGFLNRASMLAKRSGYTSSPIKRGLDVLEHVLCQEIGPPPPSAPTDIGAYAGQNLSTRERTSRTTEVVNSSCTICHTRINNLGYPFERFDALGRVRMSETLFDSNGNIVGNVNLRTDSQSTEISGASPTSVRDSVDLGTSLGTSERAMMCFAKHIKRFETRVAAAAADGCLMNSSLTALYGSNGVQGSIVQALKNYVMSDEFSRWSF